MSWNRCLALIATMLPLAQPAAEVVRVGTIMSDRIPEASGLARSQRPDRLWIINDGGSAPSLHAVGVDGKLHGEVALDGVENRDWEDLASYETDDVNYLVIADIGDNGGIRPFVSLHVVPEPELDGESRVAPLRTIEFRYPNGPQDAESIAVDVSERLIYVLTKRSIPAELYTVPLDADSTEPVVAQLVMQLDSLPQPTASEVRIAPRIMDWFWQPTGMDFSRDLRRASILTYRAVYTFEREGHQSWADAFGRPPAVDAIPGVIGAEAISIADSGVYITVEANRPPLFRLPARAR